MGYIIRNTIQNIKSGKVYSYSYIIYGMINNGEIDLLEHVPQITVNLGKTKDCCLTYKVNT